MPNEFLSKEQITALRSMNLYWKEIETRDNYMELSRQEAFQVLSQIRHFELLTIIGEYAETHEGI